MRNKEIPRQLAQLLSEVDGSTRSRLEPLVVRAVNACGCSSGAVGLLFGAAVSVLWWLTQRDGSIVMWPEAGAAAVGVLGLSLVAKLGGILFARLWLVWLRHSLMRRIGDPSWGSV